MYTVDVDIGGTLTDGLVSDGREVVAVKVDTTPHDFAVCFFDCLHEAADAVGVGDLGSFLERVDVIRWSSTISTNVLAERKGPRIGLLGSAGMGLGLYGTGRSPAIDAILDPAAIGEVGDAGGEDGRRGGATRRDEVLAGVRRLLELGVRRICVSLKGAYDDPRAEAEVKRWITDQYPDHFLGAVPTLAGTDMIVHPDDRTRTHMALVNAYVHTPLAITLFKAEEELLQIHGYRKPLYIGHVSGGVARVAKTKGFDTLESGPVFGISAASDFAARYGHDRVLTLDVGGTTAKVGAVVGCRPVMAERAEMFGIPLETPWILLRSVALGGGSVAREERGQVVLGPESMGAFPGPACYDLGGDRPTLTDAFVVSGRLDPERFLGGKRRLDVDAAARALRLHVADPLGVGVEEAATRVVDAAVEALARAARSTLEEAGEEGGGFHLYGFGGNGALLACDMAARLGASEVPDVTVFRLGHVFSAFGSSVSDVCHMAEEWPALDLAEPGALATLAARIDVLRGRVLRDLEGEQADPGLARLTAEVHVGRAGRTDVVELSVEGDPAGIAARLGAAVEGVDGKLGKLAVRGVVPVAHFEPRPADATVHDPAADAKRPVRWKAEAATTTAIHDWERLGPGATIAGPAIVEAASNTCAVPPGWCFVLDGFGNGVLTSSASSHSSGASEE